MHEKQPDLVIATMGMLVAAAALVAVGVTTYDLRVLRIPVFGIVCVAVLVAAGVAVFFPSKS